MSKPRLWVMCPLYHDVESFLLLRRHLLNELGQFAAELERIAFVVVDDSAGVDEGVGELYAFADVRVLRPPFNLGHQRALVFALRLVSPELRDDDLVITMDADGEDQPSDVPRLLRALLRRPVEVHRIVLALRTKRHESFLFKVLYFFFQLLFRALSGLVIRSGNFAGLSGWLARRIAFHPHFDLCYSSTLVSLGLPLDYVPAERGTRYAGRTRMSYSKLLMHGISMLLPFTDRIALRLLIASSMVFAGSLLGLMTLLTLARVLGRGVAPWTTSTLLAILFLSCLAFGNCIVLLAIFAQSRGAALKNLELESHEQPRVPPDAAD